MTSIPDVVLSILVTSIVYLLLSLNTQRKLIKIYKEDNHKLRVLLQDISVKMAGKIGRYGK